MELIIFDRTVLHIVFVYWQWANTVENHISRSLFCRKFALMPQFSLGSISSCTSTLAVSDFQGNKFVILQLLEHLVKG
jgi:hypothetical protein